MTTSPRNGRHLQWTCSIVGAVSLEGCLLAILLGRVTVTDDYSGNVFYYLFAKNEILMSALPVALALLSFGYFSHFDYRKKSSPSAIRFVLKRNHVFLSAVLVFLVTFTGTILVFHDFALCMDEYLANFQAQIFVSGRIIARVSEPWILFAEALKPIFVTYDSQKHAWIGIYLPVYAAIRALFTFAGIPSITNPLLAAASIVALFGVARHVWPHQKANALVAVLLLASSSQFLVTSMTVYAFPAHLFLNLLWLWLYTREDRIGWVFAPWVGVLAIGLHEPHYHALFVLPFLIRLLTNRRWRWCSYFAAVYALGCTGWLLWMNVARPGVSTGGGGIHSLSNTFGLVGLLTPVIQIMSISLLVSWQSFAMILLASLSVRKWRDMTPFLRDLIWSCLLTLGFYVILKGTQAHGWGYRFAHTILGNLALLAVVGWNDIRRMFGARKAAGFVVISSLVALLVQLPIRCMQTEQFVRPFARAMEYLNSIDKPFVVIDRYTVWYSQDLVRNDPFLRNSPKILFADELDPERLKKLQALGEVHLVQTPELTQFGMRATKLQRE
jgi:hypothetical protein